MILARRTVACVLLAALCLAPPLRGRAQNPAAGASPQTSAEFQAGVSIRSLLDGGYQIAAASGPVVYLTRSSGPDRVSGFACTFTVTNGMVANPASSPPTVASACFKLN